jgi:hypothetical protein
MNLSFDMMQVDCKKRKRPDRNPASCKIQYPMKNRDKDADLNPKIKTFSKLFFTLSY